MSKKAMLHYFILRQKIVELEPTCKWNTVPMFTSHDVIKALRNYLTLQQISVGDGIKTSTLNTWSRNDNLHRTFSEHLDYERVKFKNCFKDQFNLFPM
jgi:hypothetical protein